MLLFLTILLAGAPHGGVLRAQSNAEYNFRQQNVADGARYNSTDRQTDLTVECLAANGYGQWTMSSSVGPNSTDVNGWVLEGNGLYKPSASYDNTNSAAHPDCIASGIVANGPFASALPTEPKVAANLKGCVRYVWPDASFGRTQFLVNGLNSGDINISLTGIPNPSSTRKIVTNPVTLFAVPTSTGGLSHAPVSLGNYRDCFDLACDGSFLYIVWWSTDNSTIPGHNDIWVTTVNMSTNTSSTPLMIGEGVRPTIACDPRYVGTAQYDVAYLSATSGGTIVSQSYSGGSFTMNVIAPQYLTPTGTLKTYTNPTHVRALMSAVKGQPTPAHALYAIVELDGVIAPAGTTHIIMYRPITLGANIANYVDGSLLAPASGVPPPSLGTSIQIIDEPIIAFANAYDNQTGSYDQYHCLYELHVTVNTGPAVVRSGLIIVRGYAATTRLCLSQKGGMMLDDPLSPFYAGEISSYVGAVNQMGIHVHWRIGSNHFYTRDMNRTFDEDIDEATLVTDVCKVSDGTAHGGTVGATVIGNGRMTVWTDPNYGQPTSDPNTGTYQPRISADATTAVVGRLAFVGNNVKLTIGDGTLVSSLAVVPYFYFDFPGIGQGVTIKGNSVFEYYGLIEQHSATPVFTTPFTDGTNSHYGGGTINLQGAASAPAHLNIHGGANFYTGKLGKLVAYYGQIDLPWEPVVYPVQSSVLNLNGSGLLTLLGQTTLLNTNLYSNILSGVTQVVLLGEAGFAPSVARSETYQFSSTNCNYTNSPSDGIAELRFGHANRVETDPSFWTTLFTGGTLSAVRIHAIDPFFACSIDIESLIFTNMHVMLSPDFGYAIFVQNDHDPVSSRYGPITISNNTFQAIVGPSARVYNYVISPIYLRNFDADARPTATEDIYRGPVTVDGNDFTFVNTWESEWDQGDNAITLENTTANVNGNVINDQSFLNGIYVVASQFNTSTPLTYSLICSNVISNMFFASIWSDHLYGYVKLNTLSPQVVGFYAENQNNPTLIFNKITGYTFVGGGVNYSCVNASYGAFVDMSGVHGPNPPSVDPYTPDYAAYNELVGNSYVDGAPITIGQNGGNVSLSNTYETWPWTQYGENNITLSGTGLNQLRISCVTSLTNVGNLDRNYWGPNVDPSTTSGLFWNTSNGTERNAFNITHSASSSQKRLSHIDPPTVTCGSGTGYLALEKDAKQTASFDSVPTGCQLRYNRVFSYSNNHLWHMCYDTARSFIETCPFWPESWRAFGFATQAVVSLGVSDTGLYAQYRHWLESVLYLNRTDPEYFCQCVEAISQTFYARDTTEQLIWKGTNRQLAVTQWLLEHTDCDTHNLRKDYNRARQTQYQDWLNDTTIKLDTTLPSMHDLGLDSILNIHFSGVGPQPTIYARVLSSMTVSENPLRKTTLLRFDLDRAVYLKVDVLDELGRTVLGDESGHSYNPGRHELALDLSGQASGAYYLRISLGDGEVRTLKLIKKE